MYRAAALLASRSGVSLENGSPAASLLAEHTIEADGLTTLIDGEDVSLLIRTSTVSEDASRISVLPEIRRAMVLLQRKIGARGNTVAEGRDMGTIVFPDAFLKVYIVADFAVRLERRIRELQGRGEALPIISELVRRMLRRDRRDRERTDSPLRPAPDSVWMDTSQMSVTEQVSAVIRLWSVRTGGTPDA